MRFRSVFGCIYNDPEHWRACLHPECVPVTKSTVWKAFLKRIWGPKQTCKATLSCSETTFWILKSISGDKLTRFIEVNQYFCDAIKASKGTRWAYRSLLFCSNDFRVVNLHYKAINLCFMLHGHSTKLPKLIRGSGIALEKWSGRWESLLTGLQRSDTFCPISATTYFWTTEKKRFWGV